MCNPKAMTNQNNKHQKTNFNKISNKYINTSVGTSQTSIHVGLVGVKGVSETRMDTLIRTNICKTDSKQTLGTDYINDEVIDHNCGPFNVGNTYIIKSCIHLM